MKKEPGGAALVTVRNKMTSTAHAMVLRYGDAGLSGRYAEAGADPSGNDRRVHSGAGCDAPDGAGFPAGNGAYRAGRRTGMEISVTN